MQPRVVLVKPPERSRFDFGAFSLGVLAAAVRDLAEVEIVDATEQSVTATVAELRRRELDVVGVTAMSLASVRSAAALLRAARAALPRALLVAGGHGAAMLPRELLAAGADVAVIGEGELAFRRLLRFGVEPGARGTAVRAGGEALLGGPGPRVDPLDRLRPPARDLMPAPRDDVHLMETSRGCPHACRFCETTRFHGRRWRGHSPERVAREARRLVREHGAWIVHITDDNFAASRRRVLAICEALRRQEQPAFFLVSARADDLDARPELLEAKAAARILRVSVGVETLDPTLARAAGKRTAPEAYGRVFGRMRELSIFSVASFIVGLPGETRAAREGALELALAAAPDSAVFLPFLPLPGVPLARGHRGLEPDPESARLADELTRAFHRHRLTRERLREAARAGGVRGVLAEGTLRKHAERRARALAP